MERSDWQDRAKGIGIILVVFGHVMRGLTSAGIMPDDLLNRDVDYTLYTFHMPLFFLLSGLNVEASLARGTSRFIKKRIWTLLWPYVLWSLVQGSIQVVLGTNLNGSMSWSDLAKIGWQPYAQFWFLYVLMLCHLVAIIFGTRPAALLGLAVVGFTISPYMPYVPQKFLFNLPFYVAGILAARHLWIFEGSWLRTVLAILCFTLFAFLNRRTGGSYDTLGALPAAFCGIATVIFIVKGLDHAEGRWLASLGIMSMTIYILHILAASGTRVILLKLGVPPLPFVYLAVATFMGLALPIVAHRVLGHFGLLPWLGLGSPPNRPATATQAFIEGSSATKTI
jgi:fucose 4-O-acetylase-like acetyltransferase